MSRLDWKVVCFVLLAVLTSAVLIYYNVVLGSICLLLSLGGSFLVFGNNLHTREQIKKGLDQLYLEFDRKNRDQMNKLKVGYVIVDADGRIVWYNEAFYHSFYNDEMDPSILSGRSLENEISLSLKECLNSPKEFEFSYGSYDFTVVTTQIEDSRGDLYVINFFDVTLLKRQKEIYKLFEPIFCYLSVDNYDEAVDALPNIERSSVISQIDILLNNWAERKDAFILHYENDRYLVIFEREKLQQMLDMNFKILDEVRDIRTQNNESITLSIGVGVSDRPRTIQEAEALSHMALEIAQARGGDQAVVKHDEELSYYGGRLEAKEKSNKVKARIKAQALKELMEDADNILIMGHSTPDMDCLGSGIGLIDAARSLGKSAKYILNGMNYSIQSVVDYLGSQEDYYKEVLITPEQAELFVRKNSLLIVVDTQSSVYVDYPEILDRVKKKVIIDHHRRPPQKIEGAVLEFTEVYASSACELVTELLSYFDERNVLTGVGASTLMSGIRMDTKMFTSKTGVRTFEAASFLKRKGADTITAKNLLKDDFTTYSSRMDAMRKAVVYYGRIAISMYEDNNEYARIIASQAADELLNIRDIDASFVLVKTKDVISISGRSNGEINVQLILEKLGGGGHLTMAGAQLSEPESLQEARDLLLDQVELYLNEERKED